MLLAVGLSYTAFIMLSSISYSPTLLRTFIMKVWWIFCQKLFLHLLSWSWVFVYKSITWSIKFFDMYIEPSPNLWNKANLAMIHDLFLCACMHFASLKSYIRHINKERSLHGQVSSQKHKQWKRSRQYISLKSIIPTEILSNENYLNKLEDAEFKRTSKNFIR